MARDRIPSAQERIVALRSGNQCAYPSCQIALILDASHPEDLAKTIGKVAHICAASPGGPRYDHAMSSKERGSADNLIYLCGPHHDIVDAQLNLHTVDFMRDAKRSHERAMARASSYAIGQIGFEHLELVCGALTISTADYSDDPIELPIEIQAKIELNELGEDSREQILLGIAKSDEVARFITSMTLFQSDFGMRLAARFKQIYYEGIGADLRGDDLFSFVCAAAYQNAGPSESDQLRAAALAVVTHLFTLCEIFEHEQTAA